MQAVQQVIHVAATPPSVWNSGLCQCMKDVPSCLDSIFCYPCILAKQDHILTTGVQGTSWVLCCCAPMCGEEAVLMSQISIRGQLRGRYNIIGDPVIDSLAVYCCPPCALAQQTREMALRGIWPGGICAKNPPPP
eukprot:PhF_6_TR23801/c1_g1_i2/m.33317